MTTAPTRPPTSRPVRGDGAGHDSRLAAITTRLAGTEPPDAWWTRIIAGWVDEAAREFVDAPIQAYVPMLVERVVRDRIAATRRTTRMPR